jgi:hypothetical protein
MKRIGTTGQCLVAMFVAGAVFASAAQAAPHWYKSNVRLGSGHVTMTSKGTLASEPLPGQIVKCKVTDSEEIWNPTGGAAGEGTLNTFTLTSCKPTERCRHWEYQFTIGVPFTSSELIEIGSNPPIRDSIGKKILRVMCNGSLVEEFAGAFFPEVGVGTLIFGGAPTTLYGLSSGNPLVFTGIDKLKSPPGKITAKNP